MGNPLYRKHLSWSGKAGDPFAGDNSTQVHCLVGISTGDVSEVHVEELHQYRKPRGTALKLCFRLVCRERCIEGT